jgi:HEAT repeat protein
VPAITNVVLSAEERAAEIDRLQDWSMNDDAESLNHIVAGLTSPEKEIREAAIEATKQFGSADAISALKAAADNPGASSQTASQDGGPPAGAKSTGRFRPESTSHARAKPAGGTQ